MELKGKKINFLGDSITEGHGASSIDNCYVSLIEKKTGAVCRNYGVSGSRYALQNPLYLEVRSDWDFCMRVADLDTNADIVVVFGGTNDYGHGSAALGTPGDRTKETFWGACHTLYSSLIEKFPEATIVVLTPFHRCNEDNLRGDGSKPCDVAPLKTYVDIIRSVAEYYSLPVLDLYASSGIQPNVPVLKEKYMPDGLHPNDAGYEKLASKIIRFLENL